MASFLLTSAARHDLETIVEYIAQDNIDAALRVLERIQQTLALLAENPEIGHFRSDLTSRPVRFYSVYSYLVVYLDNTEPIQVVRILNEPGA